MQVGLVVTIVGRANMKSGGMPWSVKLRFSEHADSQNLMISQDTENVVRNLRPRKIKNTSILNPVYLSEQSPTK